MIGKHLPGDYELLLSKAGAQWLSASENDDFDLQEYDKPGYAEFLRLAREEPTLGVHEVFIDTYYRDPKKYEDPWFKYHVLGFKKLDKSNFKFPDPELNVGFRFNSVTITTPHYLPYLYQKIISLGGTIKRANIDHIQDANKHHHLGTKPDLIINCTALGSRYLGGVEDENMYPVKGHIVVLSNSCYGQYSVRDVADPGVEGELFYIMNRKEGGSIVGGTYTPCKMDEMDFKIDPALRKRILDRARKWVPELTDSKAFPGNKPYLDVVTEYVAYRPTRKGGLRVEREGNVIHNYGAGGTGYQASYGAAEKVVRLAKEATRARL